MKIQHKKQLAAYTLIFGLGRGALFFAPFLLANLLPSEDYGVLEADLAFASLLAGIVAMGTTGAIPLVALGRNADASLKGIATHHIVIVSTALIFLIAAEIFKVLAPWSLTILLTATLAMQSLASIHLKALGHAGASVLLDAGLLSLMAIAIGVAKILGVAVSMRWIWIAALIYNLILTSIYLWILTRTDCAKEPLAWLKTLRLSIPLMLGGMVSLLATTSGRLGMGLMAEPVLTAEYAVLARAATIPIVAHQLILVAKFRNLFVQTDRQVNCSTLRIVSLVGCSVIGFFFLSPWLGILLGSAFAQSFEQHRVAAFWIVSQAVLWSAIALNDLVITRYQVMTRILPFSAGFLSVALMLGWLSLTLTNLSLERFVVAHSVVMLCFYLVQSWAMNQLGLQLRKTWLLATTIFAAFMFISYFVG